MCHIDKGYFRLFPDIIHVSGSEKGIIYHLPEGKMYELGRWRNKIVTYSESNMSIEDISKETGLLVVDIANELHKLKEVGLGSFFERPHFVEKVRKRSPINDLVLYASLPELKGLRINLNGNCTNNCKFCHFDRRDDRLYPCFGCYNDDTNDSLSIEQIEKAITEASLLECKNLSIYAGSYASQSQKVLSIIGLAKQKGFERIQCFTGTSLSMGLLEQLVEQKISVIFQILSHREEGHDIICGIQGEYRRIMDNISYISSKHYPYILYYLHTGYEEPQTVIQHLMKMKPTGIVCDRLIDVESYDFLKTKDILIPPDMNMYTQWIENDKCMNSMLTLNYDGTYYYCPATFDKSIGNVDVTTIQEIFAEENTKSNSIDEPEMCQQCEYNPACYICKFRNNNALKSLACGYH